MSDTREKTTGHPDYGADPTTNQGRPCICGGIAYWHATREGGGCDDCPCPEFRPADVRLEPTEPYRTSAEQLEARNRALLTAIGNARGVLRAVRASDPNGDLACWADVVAVLGYLDRVIAADGEDR